MKSNIASVKRQLFQQIRDSSIMDSEKPVRVLEISIGTGPNLAYYSSEAPLPTTAGAVVALVCTGTITPCRCVCCMNLPKF
jgi:hypothetical protein